MIDGEALAKMRPDAVLINVSRGPIVDGGAIAQALASGVIQGAALDVFADQPLDPASPLFALPNVILTPHLSGITEESMFRMGQGVVVEVRRLLNGDLPLNFINPEALPRHRERFPQV
jgi:D-3-phosphoglycerate dehydrogenase